MHLMALCSYLMEPEKRQQDWDAFWFIQAIKGRPLRAYADLPIGNGKFRRLDNSNANKAAEIFGEMARARWTIRKGVTLVPFPDSGCTVDSKRISGTTPLAIYLAAGLLDVQVWQGLKWKKPMQKSTEGGTRDPQTLFNSLVITQTMPKSTRSLVLVDDVVTSGGHITAAGAFLAKAGGSCVQTLCAGRTVYSQPPKAFATVEENLKDFGVK